MEPGDAMPGPEIEALAARRAAAGPRRSRVGVLAFQGGFEAHCALLPELGAEAFEVRTPDAFGRLDGLVIPGGETTTILKGMERDGIESPFGPRRVRHADLRDLRRDDRLRPRPPRPGRLRCRRNAFGRQLASFEEDLVFEGLGDDPLRAVFISAPWIEEVGAGVDVLAEREGHPVAVRDGICSRSRSTPS